MTTTRSNGERVFDNANPHSGDQHRCLAAAHDPMTTMRLVETGVTAGWHCLDVAAGAGSIAHWLADRVGTTGSVLATDVKPAGIDGRPNLTVARHDITMDPLPEARFDLIVCRLLLQHLPEREQVMAKLVRSLSPGGWLQIDEFDTSYAPALLAPSDEDARLYETFLRTKGQVMRAAGGDPEWGRRAARSMRAAGLVDIDPQPCIGPLYAGSAELSLQLHHTHHLREALVDAGMTDAQLAQLRALLRDPSFRAASHPVYSTQGRKRA